MYIYRVFSAQLTYVDTIFENMFMSMEIYAQFFREQGFHSRRFTIGELQSDVSLSWLFAVATFHGLIWRLKKHTKWYFVKSVDKFIEMVHIFSQWTLKLINIKLYFVELINFFGLLHIIYWFDRFCSCIKFEYTLK